MCFILEKICFFHSFLQYAHTAIQLHFTLSEWRNLITFLFAIDVKTFHQTDIFPATWCNNFAFYLPEE